MLLLSPLQPYFHANKSENNPQITQKLLEWREAQLALLA